MKNTLLSFKSLTVASVKMYFRNKANIAFTFIAPVILIGIFSLIGNGSSASITVDITDNAHTTLSANVISAIEKVSAFKVSKTSEADAEAALKKGDIDSRVVIPSNFGDSSKDSAIHVYYSLGDAQNGQIASSIIEKIASSINEDLANTPQLVQVQTTTVNTNNLTYFDFIFPGILAMTIMQMGLLGVSTALISFKATGALRRIQASPASPSVFLGAQLMTRLLISVLSMLLMLFLGIKYLHFHMVGSNVGFILMGTFGALVFLLMGLAIAGWAKDEDQAGSATRLLLFPLLMLSGIFFPRDVLPKWAQTVTGYSPLTYFADGLRDIANTGAHFAQLHTDILGLTVWAIILLILTLRLFRWD